MWGRGAGAGASPSTTRTLSRPAAAGRRSRRRTTSRATRASTRTGAAPAARTDTSQRGPGSRMSADRPLRVAVVGSGPAGFYAAGHLLSFDLSCERAVVVGNGNVAIDVARMLALAEEELAPTDTTDAAIAAILGSGIHENLLLGRRGPAQASFTTPELKELGELADADVAVHPAHLH